MITHPLIAVHVHLYYTEMWAQLKERLQHLEPYSYDLYVTLTERAPELEADIRAFHSQTEVLQVENRGYDVGPFISVLQRLDLSMYDLVLKIHSKNLHTNTLTWINHRCVNRKWWCRLLVDSLLGSAKQVRHNIRSFCDNPQLGMLGAAALIAEHPGHRENVQELLPQVMRKLGYEHWRFRFVAGTMFMVRSCILQKIKEAYQPTDFEPTDPLVSDGTLAHAMERAFGCLTLAEGYELQGTGYNWRFELAALGTALLQFVYKKKITRKRRLIIKICRIPILNRKLPPP